MEPKLTSVGLNLDEALILQKEHDEMLRDIQVIKIFFLYCNSVFFLGLKLFY